MSRIPVSYTSYFSVSKPPNIFPPMAPKRQTRARSNAFQAPAKKRGTVATADVLVVHDVEVSRALAPDDQYLEEQRRMTRVIEKACLSLVEEFFPRPPVPRGRSASRSSSPLRSSASSGVSSPMYVPQSPMYDPTEPDPSDNASGCTSPAYATSPAYHAISLADDDPSAVAWSGAQAAVEDGQDYGDYNGLFTDGVDTATTK